MRQRRHAAATGGGGTGGTGGGGGTGGTGGGGGAAQCTPRTTISFTKSAPSVAANDPNYVALSDIDHDGHLDIVTANYSSGSFSVLLGDGSGAFALAASTPLATGAGPQIVIARDLTGDGLDDLIVSSFDHAPRAASVNVYVNQSTPGVVKFSAAKPITIPNQNQLYFLAVGKFDADTKLDLVLDDPNSNTARFYAGVGDGTFTPGATMASTNKGAKWMSAADLNGDGRDDVVVFNDTDDDMTLFLSSSVSGGYVQSRLAYDPTNMRHALLRHQSAVAHRHQRRRPPRHPRPVGDDHARHHREVSSTAAPRRRPRSPTRRPTSRPATRPWRRASPTSTATACSTSRRRRSAAARALKTVRRRGRAPVDVGPARPRHRLRRRADDERPRRPRTFAIGDFNEDGYPDVALGSDGTTITVLLNTSH